jgi:hypothetical protein
MSSVFNVHPPNHGQTTGHGRHGTYNNDVEESDGDDIIIVYGEVEESSLMNHEHSSHGTLPQFFEPKQTQRGRSLSSSDEESSVTSQERQRMALRLERRKHRRSLMKQEYAMDKEWNHNKADSDDEGGTHASDLGDQQQQSRSSPEEDPFDALRSMMIDLSQEQCKKDNLVLTSNESLNNNQSTLRERAEASEQQAAKVENGDPAVNDTRPLEPSPPEFDLCFQNDSDDCDSDEPEQTTVVVARGSDERKRKSTSLHHAALQSAKTSHHGGSRNFSAVNTPTEKSSVLKNRKPFREPTVHHRVLRKPKALETVEKSVKTSSIVGSRWVLA